MNDAGFQYCLNTSTIMGQKLSVPRQVEVAAAAGFTAILGHLKEAKARPVLSLELFNRRYWEMDALEAARTGLARLRRVVEAN